MEKSSADFENSYSESSKQEVYDDGFHKEAENKKKKKKKKQAVPLHKLLFSFADSIDILLMILGTAGAVLNGATLPILSILIGNLTNAFGGDPEINHVIHRVTKVCLHYVYLAIGAGLASFLQLSCWTITGERQAARVRTLYLKALLSQEIAFFDAETNKGEIMERMSGDIILIQEAMSEKVGSFIQLICTICGGFILAFVKDWILTLVMLSMIFPIGLCITTMSNYSVKNAICGQMANTEASEIVQQTVCSIRTVASFTGEKLSVKKYEVALRNVYRSSIHEGLSAGFGVGTITFLIFCSLSLGFWYGAKMILANGYSGGTIISTVFSILMSMISLGPVSPCMATFAAGQVAAHKMFETINRKPRIDASDTNGKILDDIHGEIEFKSVDFSYPSRPEERIFKGLSLFIQSGATVALVGGSGSGKSTVISLIERFYDPQHGEVLIDSINIKQLQLGWLRGKIGHVSQEPVLFSSSIKDNIAYGKNDATIEEITSALELANASVFTNKFPQGLDTMVGEGGIKLSGGQKQRIALARAILKDPRILLLDEATSALDVESERVVQERLERVMMNCTTIIVAHRLSTVRNADSIAFMCRGNIVERGSHLELLKDPNGAYSQFIQSQEMNQNLNQPDNYDQEEAAISIAEETQLSQNTFVEHLHSRESSFVEPDVHTDISRQGTRSDVPSKKSKKVPLGRLAYLNRPEIPFLLLGSVAAIANGLVFPIFGLLISSVIKTFYDPPEKLDQGAVFWSIMFLAIGTISLVATPIRVYFFTVAGAKLIRRIRLMTFQKIVNMEIAWFDDLENSSGAIGTRLSTDAATMKGLVGDTLALLVQSITTLIAGLVLAFVASWELSLFILAFIPLIGLNGWMQAKLRTGLSVETKKLNEEAGQVANDALGSIRTVASFSAEEKVMELYIKKYQGCIRIGIKLGVVNGIAFGVSFLIQICSYAAIFYVGAQLVGNGKTTFEKVFQTFFVISMSAMEICQLGVQMPDLDKAKSTTNSIFTTLDHKSQIDSNKDSGITLENIEGNIEFKHVTFKYPTRPDVQILQDMCLAIQSGKTVALIGESGSGKSTVISLLQRFYSPNTGKILLDGTEIQKFHLSWLRQQIGLVSQEPMLFNDTIWANIAYGKEGTVTEAEITSAAKSSNAHLFISSMKQGYQTVTGERGVQLSGGQKQRVAIARVIMKQPKILLLDEATSALDIRSEQIVQDALDNIMVDRTSIVVAHRLATIKNVDFIAVMKNGAIVEQGKHEALVNIRNGIYASMVALHSSVSL